jgi:hypothetical protein
MFAFFLKFGQFLNSFGLVTIWAFFLKLGQFLKIIWPLVLKMFGPFFKKMGHFLKSFGHHGF